jgi:hypothetical protein
MKERRATLPNVKPGKYIGKPKEWVPGSEADHFMQCPGCGEWIDMRDLGMAYQHAGELPHGPGVKSSEGRRH